MAAKRYDAVIIGGGHNGLVAAAYLAKAGKKVVVLERRSVVGGAAVTEEVFPGFRFSVCAHLSAIFQARIVEDLGLKRWGLEFLRLDPLVYLPLADSGHLLVQRGGEMVAREIARFSRKDAEAYPRFSALVDGLAGFLKKVIWMLPPRLAGAGRRDLLDLAKLGWLLRSRGGGEFRAALRVFPMSVADFAAEWFETEALRAAIAAQGIVGSFLGPRAQGTTLFFLYQHLGDREGGFRAPSLVRGGMGALGSALARAAEHYGAEIRTGAEVARVIVKEGAAEGVALKSGDEFPARAVLSGIDPRTTFFGLVGPVHLDPAFALKVKHIRFRGAVAKVNFALGELPRFRGGSGGPYPLIQIGSSIDYLERAFDDAKYGDLSREPFLEIVIPSLVDSSLAPPGKHVMSVVVQYAPYHLKQGRWHQRREELGDRVTELITRYAPNFKDSVLHRQVLTPLDLEETFGLPEGSGHHGEMCLHQLFFMRPVPGWAQYRTPILNLYLCSSATHPGGGLTGVPGHNAAREVLKDWKSLGG